MSSAQVIVLAGPSGSGKSRLAQRTGLPVMRLDDFYKDHDDPSLPRISDGPNAGLVDWDHPDSWWPDRAADALETLCRTGATDAPVYDIATSSRTGTQRVETGGAAYVIAEGIFAQDLVPELRRRGLLEAAYCITQHPIVTFWRRLHRDLREHRKPPLVLLRRGWALMRAQRAVVRHAMARGCTCRTPDQAYAEIIALRQPT